MTLGAKIKATRLTLGLTQADLAQQIDVDYTTVCRWERDNRTPLSSHLAQLSRVLHVSTDYLLGLP